MRQRTHLSYLTTPQLTKYLNQGFRLVKEYDTYCLFEKVVHGEVLYRECFHKFDLYGAQWANSPYKNQKGRMRGVPSKR